MSSPHGEEPPPVFDAHARLAPDPAAPQRLLAALDDAGIARAAVSAGGVIDPLRLSRQLIDGGHIEADADNEAVLRAAAASDDRFVPFYFANPHRGAAPYGKVGADYRGVEISPAVHGVALTDPRVVEIVAAADDLGHPVYAVPVARPGSGVDAITELARRFPRVTFVVGHAGIGNIDYHGIDLAAPWPNVVIETSGGYTSVLRMAIDRLGAGRVLFGSELPLQHPLVELTKLAVLDLTPTQRRLILWDNARRLFG